MDLQVQRGGAAGDPVYQQIAQQIRSRVEQGQLAEGERLPPIRELARSLGVNRDTVGLAYESLAAQGIVDSRVGRGTFVRRRRAPSLLEEAPEPRLAPATERLLEYERARTPYGAGTDCIGLHSLVPDSSLFPVEAFRRSLNRALADKGAALLAYGAPHGHPALREVLAERLRADGSPVGPESIVISHGATQGISLALRLFTESGDALAMEEPTYQNAIATAIGLGLRTAPVPMRRDGVDLDALDRVLARPEVRAFYTIPTFHNPMGISTGLAHRRQLLEIAARHGKPVIEDAYEMDLRLSGRPHPSLLGLDEAGLVVQLTSFSKSLFPGLRCGAVTARGRNVDALLALKQASDLGGAQPLQAALADFMRTGAYERHLGHLRRHLRRQRDAMLETLERCMPEGARWTRPEGGYQIWLELPEPLDSRELFADALRAGVLFAPGHQFLHDGRPSGGLRLTYAPADVDAIRRGVEILGRLAHQALGADAPRETPVHV